MGDAPELTSMTRRRAVKPLVTAWVFVLVIMATGVIWLSLSADKDSTSSAHSTVDKNKASKTNDIDDAGPIIIIAPPETEDFANITEAPQNNNNTSPADNNQSQKDTTPAPIKKKSLVKAPIDGLVIKGANGLLPVLGPDSMVAWKEYARPLDVNDDRPKVAIIITGIGLNSKTSDAAIKQLPGEIDLAFSPYGRRLQHWMDQAREFGHEGFLMIPAEPLKYPENDPGPHTLLAGAAERDNLKKLDWVMSQVTGYVGVMNEMGSKFTASEDDMVPILNFLNARGLMFLDARSTRFSIAAKLARRISMPRAINNLYIDNKISTAEIAQNLTALENTARTYGSAVGVARALPITIKEIETWARGLESRGIHLVPVTAVANRQPIR